jgi:hypothetical protein
MITSGVGSLPIIPIVLIPWHQTQAIVIVILFLLVLSWVTALLRLWIRRVLLRTIAIDDRLLIASLVSQFDQYH